MPVKGISPLVATVLLIAFTTAIASIISFWLIPFLKEFFQSTTQQTDIQLKCSKGGISLFDLKYNLSSSYLSGKIENTGSISLGNFDMEIIYTNYTIERNGLCSSNGIIIFCETSNLTLLPRSLVFFNLQISSNYDTIIINTNCSAYGVYDKVTKDEIIQI
jgi:flagellin-like protein